MAPKKTGAKRPTQEPKTPSGKASSTISKTPTAKAADESAAAQGPRSKKPKVDRVDPLLAGVEDGLLQAYDIPEVVRGMLLAGLPGSLLCVGPRCELQEAIVKMVDETLQGVDKALQAALEAQEAAVVAADAARDASKVKVVDADGALVVARHHLEEKRAAVLAAKQDLANAEAALAEKLATQKTGDAAFEKAKRVKEDMDKAVNISLEAVLAGTDGNGKAHCAALVPIVTKLGLDESLVNALPAACVKSSAERGHFDKVVVDALETSLKEGLASAIQKLADEVPESEQRAEAVQTAQSIASKAKESMCQANESCALAESAECEAAKAKQVAVDAVDRSEPDYKEAIVRRDEQSEKLSHFRQYNLTCFSVLRDRNNKREEASSPEGAVDAEQNLQLAKAAAAPVIEATSEENPALTSVGGA